MVTVCLVYSEITGSAEVTLPRQNSNALLGVSNIPSYTAIKGEIMQNSLLLCFCICTSVSIAHTNTVEKKHPLLF